MYLSAYKQFQGESGEHVETEAKASDVDESIILFVFQRHEQKQKGIWLTGAKLFKIFPCVLSVKTT
jgi:hypothetical protein